MTRQECEKNIGYLLEDILDTAMQYDENIETISLAVFKEGSAFAFSIKDENARGSERYFLDAHYEFDRRGDDAS